MRRTLSRLIETPERGTAKWRAKTAAKVVSDALMIAVAIVIVLRASGAFTLPEGNAKLYFDGGIALLLLLWFGLEPASFFVAKKIARRAKHDENV